MYTPQFKKILNGTYIEPDYLLGEAVRLGLDMEVLMIGILNPLLWKIGAYFEAGKISPEKEHLFSLTVLEILQIIPPPQHKNQPEMILLNAPQNTHTIGVEFFRNVLQSRYGIRSKIVTNAPSIKRQDIKDMLDQHKPKIIGVSAALPQHLEYADRLASLTKDLAPGVPVVTGGPAYWSVGMDYKNSKNLNFVCNPGDSIQCMDEIAVMAKGQSHNPPPGTISASPPR